MITQAQAHARREEAKQDADRRTTQQAQVNEKPFAAYQANATVAHANRQTRSRSEVDTTENQVHSYGTDAA